MVTTTDEISGILACLPFLALSIHKPWRYPDAIDAIIKSE